LTTIADTADALADIYLHAGQLISRLSNHPDPELRSLAAVLRDDTHTLRQAVLGDGEDPPEYDHGEAWSAAQ